MHVPKRIQSFRNRPGEDCPSYDALQNGTGIKGDTEGRLERVIALEAGELPAVLK